MGIAWSPGYAAGIIAKRFEEWAKGNNGAAQHAMPHIILLDKFDAIRRHGEGKGNVIQCTNYFDNGIALAAAPLLASG